MKTQEHCLGANGDSFGKMAFSQKNKMEGTKHKTKKQGSFIQDQPREPGSEWKMHPAIALFSPHLNVCVVSVPTAMHKHQHSRVWA